MKSKISLARQQKGNSMLIYSKLQFSQTLNWWSPSLSLFQVLPLTYIMRFYHLPRKYVSIILSVITLSGHSFTKII